MSFEWEENKADDVIDVRDIIARFEELESELQDKHAQGEFMSEFDDWITNSRDNSDPIYSAFPDDGREVQSNIEEFYKLRELLSELEGGGGDELWRGDWYPITLIRESHFTEYITELIHDCYELPKQINSGEWPYRHFTLDYEAAAEEAKQDYTCTDIDGETYYFR